jgi:hypothetical protein
MNDNRQLKRETHPENTRPSITPQQSHEQSSTTTQLQNVSLEPRDAETTTTTQIPQRVNNFHAPLSENRQTVLKTVIQPVEAPTRVATAHILFDKGAQRSFITQQLADELDLVPDSSETINLSTFGGATSSTQTVDVAIVYLRSYNGERIPLSVIIIPMIATPQ